MDPLAVYIVTKQARERAAAGNGPVMIETITNRLGPHSTAGDDPSRYRDKASFEYWEERRDFPSDRRSAGKVRKRKSK